MDVALVFHVSVVVRTLDPAGLYLLLGDSDLRTRLIDDLQETVFELLEDGVHCSGVEVSLEEVADVHS